MPKHAHKQRHGHKHTGRLTDVQTHKTDKSADTRGRSHAMFSRLLPLSPTPFLFLPPRLPPGRSNTPKQGGVGRGGPASCYNVLSSLQCALFPDSKVPTWYSRATTGFGRLSQYTLATPWQGLVMSLGLQSLTSLAKAEAPQIKSPTCATPLRQSENGPETSQDNCGG